VVFALAAAATVLASLFAMATGQRAGRGPHQQAWTVALVLFVAASAALAVGASTGWDDGTYRVFFLCGAVVTVPWLALGSVFLLAGGAAGRRARVAVVFFSGLAAGVVLTANMQPITGTAIPVAKEVFETAAPRALAGIGSGVGATVIVVGAVYSAVRLLRARDAPGRGRLAAANALIAVGTLVLSSGGLTQGFIGQDEAFALSLATGIAVIYTGFLVADAAPRVRVPRVDETPAA
jgi:hypothetical protein